MKFMWVFLFVFDGLSWTCLPLVDKKKIKKFFLSSLAPVRLKGHGNSYGLTNNENGDVRKHVCL
jgi:hypothetical protein